MQHEQYTGKIKDYVFGITRDLDAVIPKEGHDLVKDSIAEQARRLADIATGNRDVLVMLMDEFLTMMENRYDIVKVEEYDVWHRIEHEQLMKDFTTYLKWGLDAVDHFDDEEEHTNG